MLLVWSQSTNSPEDLAFAKNFLSKLFGGFSWPGSNTGFNRSDGQPETIQEQLYATKIPHILIYLLHLDHLKSLECDFFKAFTVQVSQFLSATVCTHGQVL